MVGASTTPPSHGWSFTTPSTSISSPANESPSSVIGRMKKRVGMEQQLPSFL
jgi:hypothetical protein